jgi:hypothetical protein
MRRLAHWISVVAGAALVAGAVPFAQVRGASSTEEWVLTVPSRRKPDESPAAPLALPKGADRIAPVTIDLAIRRQSTSGPSQTVRQTIVRTADRIHIATRDREWRFERNPIDPRRASASAVDHRSQSIVLYEETDLRMMLGIRGWADVLSLGFDTELLAAAERMREVRTQDGLQFDRYRVNRADASLTDLWWCEEQSLPGSFTITDKAGSTRFAIERIRAGVDVSLLAPSEVRLPKYRVVSLAEWLERH